MSIRVAINGFGRIGRAFFKLGFEEEGIEIVAINDLGDVKNMAYLLQYDSAQGYTDYDIEVSDDQHTMTVDGKEIRIFAEKNPADLPWGDHDIDVVVESTGFFTKYEDAGLHLQAGAKRVVISAPAKGEATGDIVGATVLMGINEEKLETCNVTSNASCTTNAGSPVMKIISEKIGIEKAVLNTVHSYTASQPIVDSPDREDFRLGRAGAMNMVPTTTGAAKATALAIKELEGKFDGISIRVPTVAGSLADLTMVTSRDTTVEEVNDILRQASEEERWDGIFAVNDEPIVSGDIVGSTYASIADLSFTKVVGGNLVKVLAWYDNEMGYTGSLVQHVIKVGKMLK